MTEWTDAFPARKPGDFDVAIIGIVGLPARYGGFETLVEHLVEPLSATRRVLVYCSSKSAAQGPNEYRGARLQYLGWKANGWQSILYDMHAMLGSAGRCRSFLILGVSGCLALPLIRLIRPSLRIITNIDGIEWRRRKWGRFARWVLKLSEWAAVKFSDIVIADNRAIQEYVYTQYGRKSELIAYGGVPPSSNTTFAGTVESLIRFSPSHYFLTICRIEPENNIDEILSAFTLARESQLVIVGNWNGSEYARALRLRYAGALNIQMLDPIYDSEKLGILRSGAKAYVHGHSAGGTNPSLVEAMHGSNAVLAFDVDYNRHTMGYLGWYWSTPADLARLLRSLTVEDFSQCGAALYQYAQAHYNWSHVVASYEKLL